MLSTFSSAFFGLWMSSILMNFDLYLVSLKITSFEANCRKERCHSRVFPNCVGKPMNCNFVLVQFWSPAIFLCYIFVFLQSLPAFFESLCITFYFHCIWLENRTLQSQIVVPAIFFSFNELCNMSALGSVLLHLWASFYSIDSTLFYYYSEIQYQCSLQLSFVQSIGLCSFYDFYSCSRFNNLADIWKF